MASHKEEVRANIIRGLLGQPRIFTTEHLNNLSKAGTGRIFTQEHKDNLSKNSAKHINTGKQSLRHSEETKEAIRKTLRTENPSYRAVHSRVRKRLRTGVCSDCGLYCKTAMALTHGKGTHTSPKGRPYSIHDEDYVELCYPCHNAYDLKVTMQKKYGLLEGT